ncbi:hypothetical protein [Legionella micdadei]|uniref:T2SS substrate NttA domain-containing protein n=1 Tax=Legionella micdadei TaxID=451 RepID=A0A098GHW4_LEGMI|nr:hypothetical protein [Legionella micdadei]ARG97003.1 hypothetical protein B6N58_04585 [Legionella micdadei]ARH00742.1 hypothetical protein B6V88_10115 [Legionella micdadei]KTD26717.1 hypothetical protein Lmic_2811 [Legionella micdadei]NSL18222.1 hypothetical protein [Legionella micdadei]CEG61585.1 exported protein of unknown function [Legionella micdadei]
MLNDLFCKAICAGVIVFLPAPAFADGLSKDDWINSLKDLAPAAVCKSFVQDNDLSKRLKEANISYDKCLTLIPTSFDKCQAKYYSQIPDKITKKEAEKWGNNIGMCIGGDFTVNYLLVPK